MRTLIPVTRRLADFIFMQQLHQFAVQYVMEQALAYELGAITGTLSRAPVMQDIAIVNRYKE